jgi:hypothetical protein
MIIHTVRLWCFGEVEALKKVCSFLENEPKVVELLGIKFDDEGEIEILGEDTTELIINFGCFEHRDLDASSNFKALFKKFKDVVFLGSACIFPVEAAKVGASFFIGKDGELLSYGHDFVYCEDEEEEEEGITDKMEKDAGEFYSEWFTDWFFYDVVGKLGDTLKDEDFCESLIEFSHLYSDNKDSPYYNNFIYTISEYAKYFPKSFVEKYSKV